MPHVFCWSEGCNTQSLRTRYKCKRLLCEHCHSDFPSKVSASFNLSPCLLFSRLPPSGFLPRATKRGAARRLARAWRVLLVEAMRHCWLQGTAPIKRALPKPIPQEAEPKGRERSGPGDTLFGPSTRSEARNERKRCGFAFWLRGLETLEIEMRHSRSTRCQSCRPMESTTFDDVIPRRVSFVVGSICSCLSCRCLASSFGCVVSPSHAREEHRRMPKSVLHRLAS